MVPNKMSSNSDSGTSRPNTRSQSSSSAPAAAKSSADFASTMQLQGLVAELDKLQNLVNECIEKQQRDALRIAELEKEIATKACKCLCTSVFVSSQSIQTEPTDLPPIMTNTLSQQSLSPPQSNSKKPPSEGVDLNRSLVLANVKEPTFANPLDNINHDYDTVTALVSTLGVNVRPLSCYRMPSHPIPGVATRLLKVVLPAEKHRDLVLERANKITNNNMVFKGIYIRPSYADKSQRPKGPRLPFPSSFPLDPKINNAPFTLRQQSSHIPRSASFIHSSSDPVFPHSPNQYSQSYSQSYFPSPYIPPLMSINAAPSFFSPSSKFPLRPLSQSNYQYCYPQYHKHLN